MNLYDLNECGVFRQADPPEAETASTFTIPAFGGINLTSISVSIIRCFLTPKALFRGLQCPGDL
jgi:hypothetical protein